MDASVLLNGMMVQSIFQESLTPYGLSTAGVSSALQPVIIHKFFYGDVCMHLADFLERFICITH
jgi:hypothetical protein